MLRDDDDLFAGRYELVDVLGSGGSGVVRRAHDRVLDRPVAVKLLRTSADDEALRARLRTEARLAGSLHHPGIAQVYDYGEVEVRDEPTPYLVMQYVEGTSLRHLLQGQRPLAVTAVMDVVAQVADALGAAHAAGIVHHDLKPTNVLVTVSGRAVLVDVGTAESADTARSTGADIHSLGLIAQECLAPVPDVPAEVTDLVARMVADPPALRPDAAEVARRARALAGRPTSTSSGVVIPPPPTPRAAAAARTPVWRREALRSRRVQVSAAAVVVALIGTFFLGARPAAPTRVPDVEGMAWGEAKQVLADRQLTVQRRAVDEPGAERGTVLGQDPAEGTASDDRTVVVVEVASGRVVMDPDEVVGQRYEEAARALVRLGLVPVRNDVPRPGGDGTVVTALPTGRLATGTLVTLNVGTPQP